MTAKMPSTKADYAYNVIKQDILEGKLAPGYRLRLAGLAVRYDISEMPIREALYMLRRDGLVVFKSHRGATVAELSIRELYDINSIKTYLEILAIGEAVPYHTDRSIAELNRLIDQMKKTKDGNKYSELNNEFHKLFCAPCKNEILKSTIYDLADRIFLRWSASLSVFEIRPERKVLATKEHEAILEALKARSVAKTQKAVVAHRDETLKVWQDIIRSNEAAGKEPGELEAV